MNLITFTFEVSENQQDKFISDIQTVTSIWKEQEVDVTLYRDISNQNRFTQFFQTEKTLDQLISLLQEEPSAKEIFERIKEQDSRVGFSAMEKVY